MMDYCWKQDAIDHAKKCEPEESCGIIGVKNNIEKYYPCKNISKEFKAESFVIEPLDGQILKILLMKLLELFIVTLKTF